MLKLKVKKSILLTRYVNEINLLPKISLRESPKPKPKDILSLRRYLKENKTKC